MRSANTIQSSLRCGVVGLLICLSLALSAHAQLIGRDRNEVSIENWPDAAIFFVETALQERDAVLIDPDFRFRNRLSSVTPEEKRRLLEAFTFQAAMDSNAARFEEGQQALSALDATEGTKQADDFMEIAQLVYQTLTSGHYLEGISKAEALVEKDGISPQNRIRAMLADAIFHYWNNEFITAADVTRQAIRAAETMPEAPPPLCFSIYTVEALVFYKLDDPIPVFQAYKSLYDVTKDLSLPNSTGSILFDTGMLLSKSGESDAALKVADMLAQANPTHNIMGQRFNALYLCGGVHYRMENYGAALDCFLSAEPFVPKTEARAAAWAKLLVKSAIGAGEITTARRYFETLSTYPSLTEILNERIDIALTEASLLEAEGRLSDALTAQRLAYTLKSEDLEADLQQTSDSQLNFLKEEANRLDERTQLLETQNNLQSQAIMLYQWLSGLGILLLLSGAAFVFLFYRKQKDFLRVRDEALRLSEVKSDFLANMSHEVRTPMNGVLGMASALKKTPLSRAQSDLVGVIERSAEAMIRILDDVLDLARVESGTLPITPIAFSPVELLWDMKKFYVRDLDYQSLELSFSSDIDPAVRLIGDPLRLRQVYDNLITNALKFTETGFVKVEIWLSSDAEDASMAELCFSATDSGIGMESSQIEHLFEPFTQADNSRTRRYGGTGLGLSISRKIIQQMGGRIDVVSTVNEGSTFTVRLSLPKQMAAPQPDTSIDEPDSHLPVGLKILIVEDHPVNRRVAETLFNSLGFTPQLVEDGKAAIELYAEKSFDLVLLDIQMPDLDGFQVLKEMQRIDRQQSRPAPRYVAFTANAMNHQRELYRARGFDALMVKPIHPQDIVRQITSFKQSA